MLKLRLSGSYQESLDCHILAEILTVVQFGNEHSSRPGPSRPIFFWFQKKIWQVGKFFETRIITLLLPTPLAFARFWRSGRNFKCPTRKFGNQLAFADFVVFDSHLDRFQLNIGVFSSRPTTPSGTSEARTNRAGVAASEHPSRISH